MGAACEITPIQAAFEPRGPSAPEMKHGGNIVLTKIRK